MVSSVVSNYFFATVSSTAKYLLVYVSRPLCARVLGSSYLRVELPNHIMHKYSTFQNNAKVGFNMVAPISVLVFSV